MNPVFNSSWVGRNIRYWNRHLSPLFSDGEDRVYLEIGVFEGRSAHWMLENFFKSAGSRAYLIDTFQSPGRRRSRKRYGTGAEIEARARNNLKRFGDRVEILKGQSSDVLQTEKIQSLKGTVDLAYIDGAHHADLPYQDAVSTWHLLKVGGVQVWDDTNMGAVRTSLERFESEFSNCFDKIWHARKSVGFIKKG